MKDSYDFLLAGVGGQGTLLASNVLSGIALEAVDDLQPPGEVLHRLAGQELPAETRKMIGTEDIDIGTQLSHEPVVAKV